MPEPNLHFVVTGFDTLVPNIQKVGLAGLGAGAQALYEIAETIMTAAKRLTPVDTGNLRASGHVQKPALVSSLKAVPQISVTLGFGGPAGTGNHGSETNRESVGYAFYVHENLTARHPTGQAKYLERPMTEAMRTIEQDLARRVSTILRERGLR